MKAALLAFAAIALIATAAWFGLENAGFSSAERQTGDNVRLN